jgi:hypothetical protein
MMVDFTRVEPKLNRIIYDFALWFIASTWLIEFYRSKNDFLSIERPVDNFINYHFQVKINQEGL